MAVGIDTAENTANLTEHLRNATIDGDPISFVCRYYNINDRAKNLTPDEAAALSRAGLYIVAVWENGYPTDVSYFSRDQGVHDGQQAFTYAVDVIGQPHGTPIYFAVDYDAGSDADKAAVLGYFDGVAAGYEQYRAQNGQSAHTYEIGVYGSCYVLEWCQAHGICSYFWQAQSPGWSDGRNGDRWPNANIQQGPGVTAAGLDVDTNRTWGKGGGWQVG